jgi:hypothetical protein
VFSCHRIYHFEDFKCFFPNINQKAAKLIKNRPNTLQRFANFLLQNVFGRFTRLAVLSPATPATPIPCIILISLSDLSGQAQFHKHRRGLRKVVALNMTGPLPYPPKIRKK